MSPLILSPAAADGPTDLRPSYFEQSASGSLRADGAWGDSGHKLRVVLGDHAHKTPATGDRLGATMTAYTAAHVDSTATGVDTTPSPGEDLLQEQFVREFGLHRTVDAARRAAEDVLTDRTPQVRTILRDDPDFGGDYLSVEVRADFSMGEFLDLHDRFFDAFHRAVTDQELAHVVVSVRPRA